MMVQDKVNREIARWVARGAFPGASWAISLGGSRESGTVGWTSYGPGAPAVKRGTLYDLASVSKVVGLTAVCMRLFDRGELDLQRPVSEVLPAFGVHGKASITPLDLLTHRSGLIPFRRYHHRLRRREALIQAIFDEHLLAPIGEKTMYSDLSMVVLQRMVETLTGKSLQALFEEEVRQPLGLRTVQFNPPPRVRARCAPTEPVEPWRRRLRRDRRRPHPPFETHPDGTDYTTGEVHDPTALLLHGVSGNAGLFSTASDLLPFGEALLGPGWVSEATIKTFTTRYDPSSSRALGWDTRSEGGSLGRAWNATSFGHTGFTGTSLWIDPVARAVLVFLTNRVHPSADNGQILDARRAFHETVWDALNP